MEDQPNRGPQNPLSKQVNVPRLLVLLVDDEPAVRGALSRSLSQRSFSVLTARNLRSAMDIATADLPDIILLDVRLDAEDGLRLVHLLRAAGLAIPCVVLTGRAGPCDGFKAKQLGVAYLIEKPSSPDEIAAVLRRAVVETRAAEVVLSAGADNPIRRDSPSVSCNLPLKLISTEPRSERADRMGRVLAGLISSAADVHSMDDLCERAPLGVAPSTFRRWCQDLGISPALAVEFARLLRATIWAATHGLSPRDCLDMDLRTFDKVLHRGGLTELFAEERPAWRKFIRTQQFIRNPLLLSAVEKHCAHFESRGLNGPTS